MRAAAAYTATGTACDPHESAVTYPVFVRKFSACESGATGLARAACSVATGTASCSTSGSAADARLLPSRAVGSYHASVEVQFDSSLASAHGIALFRGVACLPAERSLLDNIAVDDARSGPVSSSASPRPTPWPARARRAALLPSGVVRLVEMAVHAAEPVLGLGRRVQQPHRAQPSPSTSSPWCSWPRLTLRA